MTNAEKLAKLCNNGTNCSAPLAMLNREKAKADAIIYFSDNESWMDKRGGFFGNSWCGFGPCGHGATETMNQWSQFKSKNPKAKMICLDLVPSGTIQAQNDSDILNIGGLNDNVFMLIADFVKGKYGASYWADQIEKIDISKLDSDRN
jgi:60 kDa SS-A/Ro ribonucleoprotein